MDKFYMCIGENFKDGFRVGRCGDVMTLRQWTIELFGEKAVEFFEGDSVSYVVNYIFENAGKRLKKLS